MACSVCGNNGHNARTCPEKIRHLEKSESYNYAVWLRYGGMNKKQAIEFQRRAEDLLDDIAPESHGVSAYGKEKELPERIQRALNGSSAQNPKKLKE